MQEDEGGTNGRSKEIALEEIQRKATKGKQRQTGREALGKKSGGIERRGKSL